MGVTSLKDTAQSLTRIQDHAASQEVKCDGAYENNIYGTYVHGVFDREEVAKAVIRALGRRKGIDTEEITGVDFQEFKETQYDLLAARCV